MHTLKTSLAFCALATLLIWPALWNGQPLFFADSTAYVRGAASGFARFLHQKTVWSSTNSDQNGDEGHDQDSPAIPSGKTVLAGRSIYYGAFLYLSQLGGGSFWPAVSLQALVVVVALAMTLQTFGVYTLRSLAIICICLAALSSVPFFASYLMPDIFASIAILSWANMAVAGRRMSRSTLTIWGCLLTASLLFHLSHSVITVVLVIGTLIYIWIARLRMPWRAVGAFAAALTIAAGGEIVFDLVTKRTVGAAPLRPPFLTARLIADGPGYRYLLHSCPESGFELCQYASRIASLQHASITRPMSDEFLWNVDPKIGVFSAVDAEARRKLADEQSRFVEHTVAFDPGGVMLSAFENSALQLRRIGLGEFDLDEGGRDFFRAHVPQPFLAELEGSRVWLTEMPLGNISIIVTLAVVVSVLLTAACLLLWKPLSLPSNGVYFFSFIIGIGVFVNAIICGSLSTPHDRYQARVIWLMPFLSMLIIRTAAKTLRLRAGFAVVPAQSNSPQPDPLAA